MPEHPVRGTQFRKRSLMNRTQRKRHILRTWLEVLIAGIIYLIVITFTSFRIPCVFHLLTGLDCPGCGVTRMAYSLAHLHFREAFAANPFVLCLLPFLIPYAVYRTRKYIDGKSSQYSMIEVAILTILLLGAIAFGIIRNLPS